jgi:hypothetical protein
MFSPKASAFLSDLCVRMIAYVRTCICVHSLATVGRLSRNDLVRGGGLTVELIDSQLPPGGPSGLVEGKASSCRPAPGFGVALVEDDNEVCVCSVCREAGWMRKSQTVGVSG